MVKYGSQMKRKDLDGEVANAKLFQPVEEEENLQARRVARQVEELGGLLEL